jgi:hypothetical protein
VIRLLFQKPIRAAGFIVKLYRDHWLATPAGILSALLSTIVTASVMLILSPILHAALSNESAIIANAVVAPLLAYVLYLAAYYSQMFLIERRSLLGDDGQVDHVKLQDWIRGAKYDYIAHLPSDAYLITLAGIAQAVLERSGVPIFWAVLSSQFVDDIVTFLKEPALWGGAKKIVSWEKSRTSLGAGAVSNLEEPAGRQGRV